MSYESILYHHLFGGHAGIGGLAFVLFQEIDGRAPACDKMILVISLALAIALMILLILDHLRRGTGANDK